MNPPTPETSRPHPPYLAPVLALLFLLASAYLATRPAAHDAWQLLRAADVEGLRDWVDAFGVWGPLISTALMIAQALAAPIPAVAITATNAVLWGVLWGGLLSIASATLAAVVCYALARAWGRPLVERAVDPERLQSLQTTLDRRGALAVLFLRLLPVVPFDPVGYAAGLARMNLWTFTWATFLGQLPAGFFYSWLAVQTLDGDPAATRLAFTLLSLLLALTVLAAVLRRTKTPPTRYGEETPESSAHGPDPTHPGT